MKTKFQRSKHPDFLQNPEKTIIVADDRHENRYFLQSLLTGNGFRVIPVKNGEEVLKALHSEPVDLIITDILMPVMDGYTLCQTLQNDPAFASIPFIFYTASYTETRHKDYGLSLGADEYICKPEEPKNLLAIIRKYL